MISSLPTPPHPGWQRHPSTHLENEGLFWSGLSAQDKTTGMCWVVRVLVGETSRNLSSYQNVGSWVSETVNTASRHQRQATVGYRLVSLQLFQGFLKATLTSPDRVLRVVYRGRRRRHQGFSCHFCNLLLCRWDPRRPDAPEDLTP